MKRNTTVCSDAPEGTRELLVKRRVYGKNVGDIGLVFDGRSKEERDKKINDFIATCLRESICTVVDYESMVSKGLVTLGENDMLTCTNCSHKTMRKDHMKQHLALHNKDFCYHCKFCKTICTTQSHYKVHLRKHTGIPTHHCTKCTFATFTSTSLQSHINQVHSNVIRFLCPACKQLFSSGKEKLKHTKSCAFILGCQKPRHTVCQISEQCKFECKAQEEMLDHVKARHSVDGICCPYCPVVVKDDADMAQHKKLHVSYACTNCDFVADSKNQYLRHFLQKHGNSDEFSCYFCGVKSSSKSELDQHESEHLHTLSDIPGKIQYRCLKCNYSTTKSKILLKKHCRRLHSLLDKLSCTECDYKCSEVAQLTLHMRKHKKSQNFLCHDCGFSCKWPSQMRLHKIKHTGKKPYKCGECSYEAFRSDSITVHVMHKHKQPMSIIKPTSSMKTAKNNQTAFTESQMKSPASDSLMSVDCQDSMLNDVDLLTRPDKSSSGTFYPDGEQLDRPSPHDRQPLHDPVKEPMTVAQNGLQQKLVSCFLCPHIVKSDSALYQHICKQHKQKEYTCEECSFTTSIISKFIVHKLEHKRVTSISCPNPNCDYKACTRHHLQLHFRKHQLTKKFSCRSCSYSTKWLHQLKLHQQQKHAGHCNYRCPHCDYACYRADVLKSHILNRHTNARPHKCPLCDYSAKQKRSLKKHMVSHESERSHTCTTCGKSFKSRPVLLHHERGHTKAFQNHCSFCKFRCNDLALFHDHVQRHVIEYEAMPYRCMECPYGARKQKTLAAHKRRRHLGQHQNHEGSVLPSHTPSEELCLQTCNSSCGVFVNSTTTLTNEHNSIQRLQPQTNVTDVNPQINAPMTFSNSLPLYGHSNQPHFTTLLMSDDLDLQPLPSSALLLPDNARMFLSKAGSSNAGFGNVLFPDATNTNKDMFK